MGSKICVDRLTYRQSKVYKDEIEGLINLAATFCLQLYAKILLFKPLLWTKVPN